MPNGREQRHKDKIELAEERISNIREWHKEKADLKSRLATYKAFQEAAEALMDICAMICKDNGKTVKDDYGNIETLEAMKVIGEKLGGLLKEINGMRNRIVHEYNGFSYSIFSGNVERLLGGMEEFIGAVEKWAGK